MSSVGELRVAIDVGSKKHRVGIGGADGRVIEEFDITHDKVGFDLFFQRMAAHERALQVPVVIAMEGISGWARPLDQMIRDRKYQLLNVNNVKLVRFKEIFPGPAKSDSIDTRKILELLAMRTVVPAAKRVLHRVCETSVEHEQLKRFTRRRKQLVEERVNLLNRLQSDLQAVAPGLLEITGELGNLWFLNLLYSREDLSSLARLRGSSLLKIPGIGKAYAAKVEAWQKTATFGAEVEWVGPMIVADAQRAIALTRAIQSLEKQIETVSAASSIATRIQTIAGFGLICSATLAGEIGTLERFESEASLALYVGMAQLTHQSGVVDGSRSTKQVNTHARAAMMVAAARHADNVPQSKRYYEKKRAEGKTHNQALRSLGRHLVRVIFSMLKNQRDYRLEPTVAAISA